MVTFFLLYSIKFFLDVSCMHCFLFLDTFLIRKATTSIAIKVVFVVYETYKIHILAILSKKKQKKFIKANVGMSS
jgi:hypothetical protein